MKVEARKTTCVVPTSHTRPFKGVFVLEVDWEESLYCATDEEKKNVTNATLINILFIVRRFM